MSGCSVFRFDTFHEIMPDPACQTWQDESLGNRVFSPCSWNSSPDKIEREGAEAHASYRRAKEPGKFISEKKFGSSALGATLRRGVLKMGA